MPAIEVDIPLLPMGVRDAAGLARAACERRRRMMDGPVARQPVPPPPCTPPDHPPLGLPMARAGGPPSPHDVVNAVCRHFGISRARLVCRRRDVDICYARRIAMYLAVKLCDAPSTYIAAVFNRDRSSVFQAAKALKLTLDINPALVAEIEVLWDALDRRVQP